MDRYKRKVGRFVLVPSDGGKFEVTVGSDLVYSKLKTGEFPDNLALAKVIDPLVKAAWERSQAR
ncbi:MAG: Rdx family protein [Planctomycetes bacterium]|nr:Rdx family protein [Planctomycetota bacterium]